MLDAAARMTILVTNFLSKNRSLLVIAMNDFQAITLFGTGDPKTMAGGISQALVTTVLGLVVAIPMVLLHTLVSGRSKRIVQVLQEQSAGIIAQHAEKSARA